MASFALIGAGVAGGVVAQCLNQAGHKVTVFEKSRGTGGRIASRQTWYGTVDHGTPYFEVTRPEVASFLQPADRGNERINCYVYD
jgi:predicted NAD/FAD-dependent oxidoreductase